MDEGGVMEILLIEDNPAEARLMIECFKYCDVRHILHVVGDGEQALAFLRRQGGYSRMPRPDLILLDLKLPGRSGHEVLADIKEDEHLKRIPVVVLSSSHAERDILNAYSLHANCYITKPTDFEQFIGVVKAIEEFWLTLLKLPPPFDMGDTERRKPLSILPDTKE